MLMSGEDYLESIRDGRRVYVGSELVEDVKASGLVAQWIATSAIKQNGYSGVVAVIPTTSGLLSRTRATVASTPQRSGSPSMISTSCPAAFR